MPVRSRSAIAVAHGIGRAVRGLIIGVLCVGVTVGCGTRGDPAPVVAPYDPAPQGFYRIRPGDTLSRIAVDQGVDVTVLADWNRLDPPYRIQAGRLLRIRPPPVESGRKVSRSQTPRRTEVEQRPSAATPTRAPPSSPEGPARRSVVAQPPVAEGEAPSSIDWQWPLRGPVQQTFNAADRTRQGIRIGGALGQEVVAAAAGSVVYSGGGLKGYGNLIIIRHRDDVLTAYGFNRRLLAADGDRVDGGQPIAEVGQPPGGETQLHFEIRKDGAAVDPLMLLPSTR